MMKARQARALTEEAIEIEIIARKASAEAFCKGLEKEIKEACNNRKNMIVVDIPKSLGLYSYVIDICKDNGYKVTQLDDKIFQLNW